MASRILGNGIVETSRSRAGLLRRTSAGTMALCVAVACTRRIAAAPYACRQWWSALGRRECLSLKRAPERLPTLRRYRCFVRTKARDNTTAAGRDASANRTVVGSAREADNPHFLVGAHLRRSPNCRGAGAGRCSASRRGSRSGCCASRGYAWQSLWGCRFCGRRGRSHALSGPDGVYSSLARRRKAGGVFLQAGEGRLASGRN
jgi:hypothetical protein